MRQRFLLRFRLRVLRGETLERDSGRAAPPDLETGSVAPCGARRLRITAIASRLVVLGSFMLSKNIMSSTLASIKARCAGVAWLEGHFPSRLSVFRASRVLSSCSALSGW